MSNQIMPETVLNWIDAKEVTAVNGDTFAKLSPHNGEMICRVARSKKQDVDKAVQAAANAQAGWADTPAVQRGNILHQVCNLLEQHQAEIAGIVALET